MVVEVTNDGDKREEPRPGYEADVIFASEGVYTMDAHYDRQLITIDRSMVPKLTWGVQTPYTQGIYNISNYTDLSNTPDPGTVANLYDYKWVKFAINNDYKVPDNEYVKYPGDKNYNGGTEGGGEASPYYSLSGKYHASNADSKTEAARMYDIHGLLKRLKQEYDNGQTTGTVAITAFVDEYVYATHPKTGVGILSQWSDYVDAEDRLMYFVNSENSQYSPDGNSSIVEAVKSFRQNPIRTVYDTGKGLKSAWGTESILNSDLLATGDVSNGNSTSNGRLNTIQCLLGMNYENPSQDLRWSQVLQVSFNDPDEHYMLQQGYQDALHATLIRNRDLNGDDIVDYKEIRWYLAAKDQLVDLYIGEPALDSDAHLYPDDPSKLVNGHYIYTSSSYNDGEYEAWVYWSEECAALGNYLTAAGSGYMNGTFPYRCLRNVGIDITDPKEEPVALIPKVTQAESDGTYLIDCSNLNEKARRTSYEAGSSLGRHDDESPQNRPYAKFRVSAGTEEAIFPKPNCSWDWDWGWKATWNDQKWDYFQTQTPSGGYRTPNLRELLIMATRLPQPAPYDSELLARFKAVKGVIVGIRNVRKQDNLPFKDALELQVKANDRYPAAFAEVIRKMGNLSAITLVSEAPKGAYSFIADAVEYFIPMTGYIDTGELRAKLEEDLAYTRGFLASVMKKLGNERFVNGAPAQVVANERKKQADAEAKIAALEAQLELL